LILVGPEAAWGHRRAGHPERPERAGAAAAGIFDLDLGSTLRQVAARPARIEELARVHHRAYLERLESFCAAGGGDLDQDTYAEPASWAEACVAAGAGLAAIEAMDAGDDGPAFVAVRPPGHHAVATSAMGFCLLGNVAVAAASLAERGERVLVLDWDVHHGNGTEAAFWDDRRVLYVSTHQWPLYPGTGRATDVGGATAAGLTVNIPLPPGATGDVVRRALDEVAWPVVDDFAPTWVLVSAGFDAHRDDPLAGMALSAGDFADLSRVAAEMAPRRERVALFLEGGYHLAALRGSVAAAMGAFVDSARPAAATSPERSTTGGPGADWVARARIARDAVLDGARPRRSRPSR